MRKSPIEFNTTDFSAIEPALEIALTNSDFQAVLLFLQYGNYTAQLIEKIIKAKKLNDFAAFTTTLDEHLQNRLKINISIILGQYLFVAIENNDPEFLRLLLSMGADRGVLSDGFLPVQRAVDLKSWGLIDVFADYPVDQENDCHYGYALLKATESKEIELAIKLANSGANVHWHHGEMLALHYAAIQSEYGLMRTLIRAKAPIEINDMSKRAWEFSIDADDIVGLVVFAASKSIDIEDIFNKILSVRKFELFFSFFEQFDEKTQCDYKNYLCGKNKLFMAIENNNTGLVEALLKLGIDQTVLKNGQSAILSAVKKDIKNNAVELTTVFSLFSAENNTCIAALYGQAALYAAKQNQFELSLLLLNSGACLKQTTSEKFSVLHLGIFAEEAGNDFLGKLSELQFRELIKLDKASPFAWEIAFAIKNTKAVLLLIEYGIAIAAFFNRAQEKNEWQFFCELMDAFCHEKSDLFFLITLTNEQLNFLLERSIEYKTVYLEEKILEKTTSPVDPINQLFAIKKVFINQNMPITKSLLTKIIFKFKLIFNEDLPKFFVQLNHLIGRLPEEKLSDEAIATLIVLIEDCKRENSKMTDRMMLSILEASPTIIHANKNRVLPQNAMSAIADFFAYEMLMNGKNESNLTASAAITFCAERYPDLQREDILNSFRNPVAPIISSNLYRFTFGLAGSALKLAGSAVNLVRGGSSVSVEEASPISSNSMKKYS
ncbi:MAG: hypothetical protein A3E82_07830 [Gammaproteobacteria bacterium RIFCSPHIGHO2_12_FULL_38_11]|nr:MAG: hypothetical protein A3E82_07830 [Gammaproteobacteria bacterium RIFCSPHIGHO2_12_FULL_38_11]